MAYFSKKFHKIVFFLPFLISINLYTVTSNALPAPLSKEQLLKESNVIARVKVIGVTKIGYVKNAIKYQAWLSVASRMCGLVCGLGRENITPLIIYH